MHSPILLLLSSSSLTFEPVRAAAARANLQVHAESAAGGADPWLERHHPPAIVVDATTQAGAAACERLRHDPGLANVPVLGLSEEITELPFEEMLSSGGDDLCLPEEPGLARRLRLLMSAGEVPLSKRRGIAVVVDADRRGRILTARALRNAGYGVSFALDPDHAVEESLAPGVELVVWHTSSGDIASGEDSAPARARRRGSNAPWVVGVPPKEMARARAATHGVSRVAVYDAFGPSENVLFVANDLTGRRVKESRESARLLYGTTISFRTAGAEDDEVGYSYNLSAGGLYVRTLAPPARGSDVWLELRPPRCDRRVRVEGRVVWTRGFGPNDAATVPPGFGVQLTGGSLGDLERYGRGYHAFAAELG